jgi:hypothetical protein
LMKIRRIQEEYYIFPRVLQYSIFQGYIVFVLCSERVFWVGEFEPLCCATSDRRRPS